MEKNLRIRRIKIMMTKMQTRMLVIEKRAKMRRRSTIEEENHGVLVEIVEVAEADLVSVIMADNCQEVAIRGLSPQRERVERLHDPEAEIEMVTDVDLGPVPEAKSSHQGDTGVKREGMKNNDLDHEAEKGERKRIGQRSDQKNVMEGKEKGHEKTDQGRKGREMTEEGIVRVTGVANQESGKRETGQRMDLSRIQRSLDRVDRGLLLPCCVLSYVTA